MDNLNNSNNNKYYSQCFWHANGTMVCKKMPLTYDPNLYKKYVLFNNFSDPNENYQPNNYRNNKDYYEKPLNYNSGVDRQVNDYSNSYDWLSPPHTKTRTE